MGSSAVEEWCDGKITIPSDFTGELSKYIHYEDLDRLLMGAIRKPWIN